QVGKKLKKSKDGVDLDNSLAEIRNYSLLVPLPFVLIRFHGTPISQSRLSPFAYSKARRERNGGKEVCPQSSSSNPKKFMSWFSLIEAVVLSRKRTLLPVKNLRNSLQLSSELHRTLYGFIVFEVAWTSVRGINYYNDLQTDTSLAIEAKMMKRWEFDNISQAASCVPSWFSGTISEQMLLKEHLDSAAGGDKDSHHFFLT
ncbi:unnamed protein product, partial [Sphenostylis stenocarpa]